jgi:hypothetical protein
MITGPILCDAFAQVERVGLYGSRVVKLWMNAQTYKEIWTHLGSILYLERITRFERILEEMSLENLGTIWGAEIGISENVPDDSLLVLSEKDPIFEAEQTPEESRLFRYQSTNPPSNLVPRWLY